MAIIPVKSKVPPNFIEVVTSDDANKIPLDKYTFVKFSERRQVYIFKRRQGK